VKLHSETVPSHTIIPLQSPTVPPTSPSAAAAAACIIHELIINRKQKRTSQLRETITITPQFAAVYAASIMRKKRRTSVSLDDDKCSPSLQIVQKLFLQYMQFAIDFTGVLYMSYIKSFFYILRHIHRVSIKTCQFYFFNNSVKHCQILIIFDTQYDEKTGLKWL